MAKIFRATLSGDYFGSNWANVYHYLSASDDDGQAGHLSGKWVSECLSAHQGIMNNQVALTSLNVVDVPDTGDYATETLAVVGSFGSNTTKMPPAYTYSFTGKTTNSPIRHGFKRYVGVDETAITTGDANATWLAAATTLNAKVLLTLVNAGYTFIPIIPRYTGTPAEITLYTALTGFEFTKLGYQRTREA